MSEGPSDQREGIGKLFDELEAPEDFAGALLDSLLFGIR